MIPKIIHYCWFGHHPKSSLIQKCIQSWKRYMPDFEIWEWNEENYDVTKNEYLRNAYGEKKWAFVVDCARFDILNTYGGIFLDTDVELLKPFPQEILNQTAFSGFEGPGRVNPGLVYGSVPDHPLLKKILIEYEKRKFGEQVEGRIENIVDIVSRVLETEGLKRNGELQELSSITIYPKDYFCCFNFETQGFEITENTVSIHHYAASWTPLRSRIHFKMIKMIAQIMGKERYLALKKRLIKSSSEENER